MSGTSIGFWTPVVYSGEVSFGQKIAMSADYFFTWGKFSTVWRVCGEELKGVTSLELDFNRSPAPYLGACTAALCVMSLLGNALSPTLGQYKIIRYSQALVVIPLAMLVIKYVSRLMSNVYPYDAHNKDLIPISVKIILDRLLGEYGAVDKLPVYDFGDKAWADPDKMIAPIMKGIETRFDKKATATNGPKVVLKMRNKTSNEVKTLYLWPSDIDNPLKWRQSYSITDPKFFEKGIFTDGSSTQSEGFKKLQTIIQTGQGLDIAGQEWELIR